MIIKKFEFKQNSANNLNVSFGETRHYRVTPKFRYGA